MWKLKVADGGDDQYLYSTNNYVGRQIWEFDPDAGTPEARAEVDHARQHFWNNRYRVKPSSDLLSRMQFLREKNFEQKIPQVKIEEGEEITYEKATTTLKRAVHFFSALQADDGHWAAENAGPLFFLPPLVMCTYITGHLNTVFPAEHRKEILRYLYCHQVCAFPAGFECNFFESMEVIEKLYISTPSVPPEEFWILPSFLPMHPAKMWCYCRMVYMPMSYLYGKRFVVPITTLILQLREELFAEPYDEIKWRNTRHWCSKEDMYYPHPLIQDLMWDSLYLCSEPLLTRWPLNKLREKALKTTMKHIHYEDENSRYISIGSVEKVLCMLACWVEDPKGDSFKKHLTRIPGYLWVAEDGMKMQSFGSQLWDTGFAIQALLACKAEDGMILLKNLRLRMIGRESLKACIDIFQRERGLFQIKITDGNFLIAQQKG